MQAYIKHRLPGIISAFFVGQNIPSVHL